MGNWFFSWAMRFFIGDRFFPWAIRVLIGDGFFFMGDKGRKKFNCTQALLCKIILKNRRRLLVRFECLPAYLLETKTCSSVA